MRRMSSPVTPCSVFARWKAGDNARSGAAPLTSQPQTNPKYQFVNALYSSLAVFETTNRVLQLVENTLIASLITQKVAGSNPPPATTTFIFHGLRPTLQPSRICRETNSPVTEFKVAPIFFDLCTRAAEASRGNPELIPAEGAQERVEITQSFGLS